ncbi:MAG: glutamate--tRNA ligase family protein, partial [Planctomycetaceae bacterium]
MTTDPRHPDPAHAVATGRTRFAPSPTGRLHLGHVASMLAVWGLADAWGLAVDVRIEDHDRQRCRPEHLAALRADLDWLEFEPARGGRWSLQSEHADRFDEALDRLCRRGLIYACHCSRRDLPPAPHGVEACYPGTCRERNWPLTPDSTLRVRLVEAEIGFHDLWRGEQRQTPARQCGDLVVRDRHGQYTYQFAVVVDDLADGIDTIIRGADLLDSTGRQLQLRTLLGGHTPLRFAHHPLLVGPDGQKLSKSLLSPPVSELREAGWSAAQVRGLAAHRVGWLPQPSELP